MGSGNVGMGNYDPTTKLWELITKETDGGEETQGVEGSGGTGKTEKVFSGENISFAEGVSDEADATVNLMPLDPPDADLIGDDSEVSEQILANLREMNKILGKSIAEVKKHSGMAKAMLKASGIDLGSTSKVFFDVFMLMALMIETAQRQRDAAREMRQASLAAVVTSLEKQADKQLEAATERRNAALVSAGIAIGMGVLSLGMSGISGVKGMKAQALEMQADQLDDIADPVLDAAQTGVPNALENVQAGGIPKSEVPGQQNPVPQVKDMAPKAGENVQQPPNEVPQQENLSQQKIQQEGHVEEGQQQKQIKEENVVEVELEKELPKEEKVVEQPKQEPLKEEKVDNGAQKGQGAEEKTRPSVADVEAAKQKISDWGKTWDGKTKPPKDVTDAARTVKRGARGLHMEAKLLEIKQTRIKQASDAMMNMVKGFGDIFAAQVNLKAEMAQIEATREQINQKTAESSMQDATEAMQAAQEIINTVIRAMMQIKAAEIEMMKTMSFA